LIFGVALSKEELELITYAEKITLRLTDSTIHEIEGNRNCGFEDRAILDNILIIGYFCFINSIVFGTGIVQENNNDRIYKY
jgi:hypothetical protein